MSKETIYRGPGFCSLLGLVFIILKLCNVIDWSWWWVLAPLWIQAVLVIFAIIVILVICWFSKSAREYILEKFK